MTMSALVHVIDEWTINDNGPVENRLKRLFMECLHLSPYFLRYSIDRKRPELVMIHATPRSDVNNRAVQEANGIVLDQNDNFKIVSQGMTNLIELESESQLTKPVESYQIEQLEDGTVLRVWWYKDEWLISTNRRIDSKKVKWCSNKSFYDMFCDVLMYHGVSDIEAELDRVFDKNHAYSFVLLHPENRLVIDHPVPQLVHVSTRDLTTSEEVVVTLQAPWTVLPVQGKNPHLNTVKRGLLYTDRSDPKHVLRYKVDYPWYACAHELRKNQPYLHLSYLACSMSEKAMFRTYFGSLPVFDTIDLMLRDMTTYVFHLYRSSFVHKHFQVMEDHPIYSILRLVHRRYKTTKFPIRIADVRAVIEAQDVSVMDPLLQYFAVYGFVLPETKAPKNEKSPKNLKNRKAKRIDDPSESV